MVRSGYPFRDSNRGRPDDTAGNRRDDMAGNRREDMAGNRREEQGGLRRDTRGERRPRPETPPAGLSDLTSDLEELFRLLAASDVTELQIERGDLKLTIRRGAAGAGTPAATGSHSHSHPFQLGGLTLLPETLAAGDVRGGVPVAAAEPARATLPSATPTTPVLGEREHLLTAPMVGTFYTAASPKDPPFVVEGDLVEAGQTIGIIEAMKIMNEIEAEVTGRVKRVLIRDAQGVEFGQPLMVIEEV